MTTANLLVETRGPVAVVTFNRPTAMNALNPPTLQELGEVLSTLEADESVRVVVLTGAGKAFVAGADISAMQGLAPEAAAAFSRLGTEVFRRLERSRLVTIGAVNGFALGGGCELAMACDFLYASTRAKFGQPEVKLGLIAGFGGTQRLTHRVGPAMALELLATGRMIDAAEALRIGLVNRVVEGDVLLETVMATAEEICAQAPLAVAASKRLVQAALDLEVDAGLQAESDAFGGLFGSADSAAGIDAFLGKRAPTFTGR